jgi:hypothetical protein
MDQYFFLAIRRSASLFSNAAGPLLVVVGEQSLAFETACDVFIAHNFEIAFPRWRSTVLTLIPNSQVLVLLCLASAMAARIYCSLFIIS